MKSIVHTNEDGTVVAVEDNKVFVGTPRRIGWHELDRQIIDEGTDGWKVKWVAPHDSDQIIAQGDYENLHYEDDPNGGKNPDGTPRQVPVGFDPDDGWPHEQPQTRAWIDGDGVQHMTELSVTVYDYTEIS